MGDTGTLADELLADLNDLGGGVDEDEGRTEDDDDMDIQEADVTGTKGKRKRSLAKADGDGEMDEGNEDEDDESDGSDEEDMDVDRIDTGGPSIDLEALAKANDIFAIAKLVQSRHLQETMKRVEEFMSQPLKRDLSGPVEDHPEYRLVVTSNKLIVDIDNEAVVIHKFIRDYYAAKFPELESLVPNAMDYIRTVRLIGNETDLTQVNLASLLPSATVMVVTVTGSTTEGQPLPPEKLKKVMDACDMAISLDDTKRKLLQYVETRMGFIAPNMTAICGSVVAAKLMGVAGGLTSLSRMPACNIQVLGAAKKTLQGFSNQLMKAHQGFVYATDIAVNTPPDFRRKAARLIADKCCLAARVDSFHESAEGSLGQRLRSEIIRKLEKAQEPPPGKQVKPLPVPLEGRRKRRGGKRARKQKERMAITDLRKAANRVEFGVPEEEAMFGDTSKGLGKLTGEQREISGKVRAAKENSKNKVGLSKKQQQQLKSYSGSSTGAGSISGLSSSLVFTPVQGLELANPEALKQQRAKDANDKWFGATSFIRAASNSSTSSSSTTTGGGVGSSGYGTLKK